MNLQPTTRKLVGQKEFLRNSVGLEFKTAGASIDSDKFTGEDGYIKAGTAVSIGADGFYVPFDEANPSGAGLTAHDVQKVAGGNAIIGVLVSGHPIEDKCTGVTEAFKEATAGYLRFDV